MQQPVSQTKDQHKASSTLSPEENLNVTVRSRSVQVNKLRCPECKKKLQLIAHTLTCEPCQRRYMVREGQLNWSLNTFEDDSEKSLFRIKQVLRKLPWLYNFLLFVVGPVIIRPSVDKRIFKYLRRKDLVLNLGSGTDVVDKGVVNIDMFNYDTVDMIADIENLPFADESVDGVMSRAVLEHVTHPEKVISESKRVLRPGGYIYTVVPFVVPFHDSPGDYFRWTAKGMEKLHEDFEVIENGVYGGPASALCWMLQDFFAVLFSFGSNRLHSLLAMFFMLLFNPIKWLDYLLVHLPNASNSAAVLYFIGRKR